MTSLNIYRPEDRSADINNIAVKGGGSGGNGGGGGIKNQQEALMDLGIKKGEATKSNTGPGARHHLLVVATFVIWIIRPTFISTVVYWKPSKRTTK